MNTELQKLKDIHLPPVINRWPIAPGWLLLFILGLGSISYLIYFLYRKKKRFMVIKSAIRQLKQLQKLSLHNPDNVNVAAEISILIRRTALCYFERSIIAGLSGQTWLKFLNESGQTEKFTSEAGQLLIIAPYCKNSTADLTALFILTEEWLMQISKMNKKER